MSAIQGIEVPKWGLSMEEGTLSNWLIAEGDSFKAHQEICEIETSKISNVMEAPFDGVLRRIVAKPGETLPVGGLLGVVADASVPDAEIDAFIASRSQTNGAPAPAVAAAPSPAAAPPASAPKADAPAAAQASRPSESTQASVEPAGATQVPQPLLGKTDAGSVFATPHALRLANELGIDLGKVNGSGRGGRISLQDLENAIVSQGGRLATRQPVRRNAGPPRSRADDSRIPATPLARRLAVKLGVNLNDCRATGSHGRVCQADVELVHHARQENLPAPQQALVHVPDNSSFGTQPLSAMRRAIAARLQESKRNAPHYRLTVDLDLERMLSLRQEINASVPGVKVSVNDLLIKACAQALLKVPDVNVQYDEASQSIRRYADADIAVAVALPAGLITPIVRAANRKSIAEISEEMHRLATKAKAGTLKPDEFQGGTFSLSNLGMLGVRQFDAIINPPQAAILAIGAGEQRVVVHEGEIAIRNQVTVSLSCDHRVIDGALGATFLQELKRLVQAPTLMLA
ncbi:2-oxo acid dehydrogenase subunit E2 [Azomonas macrocytogenes]|uniref:Dihydrolipoamide acetyltransferase component of pyruvate dehydrogenase complex n=1 Tax=Azomonas macrocytogenes TaxID=69962 RepID=A0A839T3K5_AZOMA|nr:2-oxo acid dehydrogenase subunit E2 [Azomonas macrocytogenes]MBB3103589.1 pyruvate dehydrogenase E2 component (dihydrolipoamide acetyltransferase) [Azomonas macrocytogenes]